MATEISNKEKQAALNSIADLYIFLKNFWHVNNSDPFIDSKHIKYLCDQLTIYGRAISKREFIEDLIINIPPGMSKSSIVNHAFQVWVWLLNPSTVFLCSCNSSTLAKEHSLKAKAIFKSERFQRWYQSYFKKKFGKNIFLIKDTEIDWSNNFNGRRYSTYTNGPVIGIHAHAQIWDDPMSVQMTYSENEITKVHKFNDEALSTRKKNKATTPTITVMQRLSPDDTTGHELKKRIQGKKIKLICMPATLSENVEPPEVRELYTNGYLDPNRCGSEILKSQKIDLGSSQYEGQYEQNPTDDKGGIFKRDWFEIVEFKDMPPEFFEATVYFNADTSTKIKESNDPSGIIAYVPFHNDIYVVDWRNKRLEFPELCEEIISIHANEAVNDQSLIFIEPKSSGSSAVQQVRRTTRLNVVEFQMPVGDKMQRAKPCTPYCQAGRVKLIKGYWNKDFIDQLVGFPKGKHDEAVDNLSMMVTQALIRGGFRPSGRRWSQP